MTTYTKKFSISKDTSYFRIINNVLYDNIGSEAFVNFIDSHYLNSTQFSGALNLAIQDMGIYSSYVDRYSADSLLSFNNSLYQTVLMYYCNQANLTEQQQINNDLWTNMKDSVFDQCNLDFLTFIEAVLSKDNSSNELLNSLTIISLVKIRQVYQALGGSMPFPPNPVLISFIRTQANSDVSLQINNYYTQSEIKSALKSCSTSLLEDVTDPSTGSYS
jgi:hypothetical protein